MHQRLFYLNVLSILCIFHAAIQSADNNLSAEEKQLRQLQWETLLFAVKEGDLKQFETLATKEIVSIDHGTLMTAAASTKHQNIPEIIHKLTELGIQPNIPTTWTKASHQYTQWSCTRLRIDTLHSYQQPHINEHRLPLDVALLYGNVTAAQALLEHGANPVITAIHLDLFSHPQLSKWDTETPFNHAHAYKIILSKGEQAHYDLKATDEELDLIIALLKKFTPSDQ